MKTNKQGGVTLIASVLPSATAVEIKVNDQVNSQATDTCSQNSQGQAIMLCYKQLIHQLPV